MFWVRILLFSFYILIIIIGFCVDNFHICAAQHEKIRRPSEIERERGVSDALLLDPSFFKIKG